MVKRFIKLVSSNSRTVVPDIQVQVVADAKELTALAMRLSPSYSS